MVFGLYSDSSFRAAISSNNKLKADNAFKTGFLYARLLGKDFEEMITIAQKLAVLKLQNVGRLPEGINIKEYLASGN